MNGESLQRRSIEGRVVRVRVKIARAARELYHETDSSGKRSA